VFQLPGYLYLFHFPAAKTPVVNFFSFAGVMEQDRSQEFLPAYAKLLKTVFPDLNRMFTHPDNMVQLILAKADNISQLE